MIYHFSFEFLGIGIFRKIITHWRLQNIEHANTASLLNLLKNLNKLVAFGQLRARWFIWGKNNCIAWSNSTASCKSISDTWVYSMIYCVSALDILQLSFEESNSFFEHQGTLNTFFKIKCSIGMRYSFTKPVCGVLDRSVMCAPAHYIATKAFRGCLHYT